MQDIFGTKSNYYNTRNAPVFLQEILKLLDMDKDHLFHGSNNLDLVLKEMK